MAEQPNPSAAAPSRGTHAHQGRAGEAASPAHVKDPVCGMPVDPATAAHQVEYDHADYFFCSAGCKARFEADPARYAASAAHADGQAAGRDRPAHHGHSARADDLQGEPAHRHHPVPAGAAAAPAGTLWTCPMHPEIRRDGPGSESAGVTLLKGDLNGIVRARRLSQATRGGGASAKAGDTGRGGFRFADRQGRAATSEAQRIVLGNAAFVYNAASVPIAAGVLYPVFGLLLSPILAATAMALSSVSVICNALRLRTTKVA